MKFPIVIQINEKYIPETVHLFIAGYVAGLIEFAALFYLIKVI